MAKNVIAKELGVAPVIALILLSKDEIKAHQDSIRVNLLSLDAAIHANAVQCLMHAEKHGDTSLMRRLLMDVIDDKSGYRRQGLIKWMRAYSPMELKGKDINLSGTDGKGVKRPFMISEADADHFAKNPNYAEQVKPIYQQTILSKFNAGVRDIMNAMENTLNGKPIDPKKPYFDGKNGDVLVDFAKYVKDHIDQIPADTTLELAKAKQTREEADEFIKANEAEGETKVAANG